MASERNYRNEAVSARRAARDTLRSLREARRQSKVRAQKTASPKKTGGQGSLIEPDAFFSISPGPSEPFPEDADQHDEPASETAASIDDAADAATGPEADDVADFEDHDTAGDEDEAADDLAESSAEAVAGDAGELGDAADPGDADMADAGEADEQDGPDAPESPGAEDLNAADPNSDLFDLPGAGAGIVWMFHQCGIRTLSDLAQADAQELSAKLGVVGHILNIQPWISYAREAEAESAE